MGIFTRVRDIISANINSMLDKAEDPEKLVKLMIREMEDTLVEIKASCAGAMATKKKIQRELEQATDNANAWEQKAELAIEKGREDLAREALVEKKRHAERADTLDAELKQCSGIVAQYQGDIAQLEEKVGAAREKQRMLLQRHTRAQTKNRAQGDIRKMDTANAMKRFDGFEEKIERMETDADLVNYGRKPDLEEQFRRLQGDEEIDKELEALKAKKGGSG
jgi:phage shock protein A